MSLKVTQGRLKAVLKARCVSLALLIIWVPALVPAQTYSIPLKLPLEAAARREFREWWTTAARYPGLVPETFFPIGWSKDGKFAYYYEPVDEASGCYFAHLVIQDMRTDKVLYEFKYNQDDTVNEKGDMTGPGNMHSLWKKNQKLFSTKLREHAILAGTSVLLGKTFTVGRSYTVGSAVTMGKDAYDDERVARIVFTLSSNRTDTKTIYDIDHSKDEFMGLLDAGILGVIKSPYEPRVAVIGMEIERGWEGPPHNGDIRIVGADLKGGFTRE